MPIYYIDNNRGNNANTGLSPAQAWKSLSQIAATTGATAGDAFLLADDSEWVLGPTERIAPPTSWTGQENSPVVIGKYSPSSQSIGQYPFIQWYRQTVPSDWTYNAGLNGWTYAWPTNHINKAALVRIADTWLANATDQAFGTAVASVDGRYNPLVDSQTLLLYAPAGQNPVAYYGSVLVSAQASGAIVLSSGRRWVTVQDIEFRNTGCGVSMFSGDANPAGFVVQRCRGKTVGSLAFISGQSSGNLKAWVSDCDVRDFGATALQVNATGGAGITYAEISDNRIDDGVHQWAQGGIYIQGRNTARDTMVKVLRNEVSRCRRGTRDKAFDGCGIYAEIGADGVLIANNVIHDCFQAMQDNSGRRIYWYGNLVYNCRSAIRISDESNAGQSDCRMVNNTLMIGDESQTATEFGNSTSGGDYPAFWMSSSDDPLSLTAWNNIIVNTGGARARAVFGLPATYLSSTYSINKNWVFGFETDSLIGGTNGTPSPAPTVNNAGTTDPRPLLASGFVPKVLGTTTESSLATDNPLALAGTYVQGVHLQNGRMRPGFCPVGAYQAVLPKAIRT